MYACRYVIRRKVRNAQNDACRFDALFGWNADKHATFWRDHARVGTVGTPYGKDARLLSTAEVYCSISGEIKYTHGRYVMC